MIGFRRALLWLLAFAVASCQAGLPGPLPGAGGPAGKARNLGGAAPAERTAPLAGRVVFPARTVQATMSDVAAAATVSLIDTARNRTVAATVTDDQGSFRLEFSNGFAPAAGATYYLEAVKGLESNLPGHVAPRVRTLAQYRAGRWSTITAGGIIISRSTTALALGAALRHGNPDPFDFDALIGSVTAGSPDVFRPVTGLSEADYSSLVDIVTRALLDGADPVHQTGLLRDSGRFVRINAPTALSIAGIEPRTGTVGTFVVVRGAGFAPNPAGQVVRFNAIPATPASATENRLEVAVPPGATSGPLSVQVGNLVVLGPPFSVEIVLSGFEPAVGAAGTQVRIAGSGFDTGRLDGNAVSFGGVAATVIAAGGDGLTVTVPTGAVSGPITVAVGGGSPVTTAEAFTVPVTVSGLTPASGQAGDPVTLAGSGFSPDPEANAVRFGQIAATVLAASSTGLQVAVPDGSGQAAVSVTVAGQTGTSPGRFAYLGPLLGALHPAVLQTGRAIWLEGWFANSATVNFPGGHSPAATVLGTGRARVAAPGSPPVAGSLSVTTGGSTTAAQAIRTVDFTPGLSRFQVEYEQVSYGRSRTLLATGRYYACSAVVGPHVYVIGGQAGDGTILDSAERALINADGTLGHFEELPEVRLRTARGRATCAVLGGHVYVLGGLGEAGGPALASVERADIQTDGTLGDFQPVPGGGLAVPRAGASSNVVGHGLYVIGGSSGDQTLSSIERADILPDGSLGAFSVVEGTGLPYPRALHASVVSGAHLYVIGGHGGGVNVLGTVDRAPIDGNGTLGAFTDHATLQTPRFGHVCVPIGDHLYVLGGYHTAYGHATDSTERLTIGADGSLGGSAAAVPAARLTTPRAGAVAAIAGNLLHVIGGAAPGTVLRSAEHATFHGAGNVQFEAQASVSWPDTAHSSFATAVSGNTAYVLGGNYGGSGSSAVNRATVRPDGTLAGFASAGVSLRAGRYAHTGAAIGKYLYVFGGTANSVERARLRPDGTIDPAAGFETVSGIGFSPFCGWVATAVVGKYVYVLGGSNCPSYSRTVQRAEILAADGSALGNFTASDVPQLLTAREQAHAAVLGKYLYVIGGVGSGALWGLRNVERAEIVSADGAIGQFSSMGDLLHTGRRSSFVGLTGNYLVMGGEVNGDPSATTQRAPIGADGALGAFSPYNSLTGSRWKSGTLATGRALYILRGNGWFPQPVEWGRFSD